MSDIRENIRNTTSNATWNATDNATWNATRNATWNAINKELEDVK